MAKARLRRAAGTRRTRRVPMRIPAMATAVNARRKPHGVLVWPAYPSQPAKVLRAITRSDVPTASFIGMPASRTRAGTIRNPPPIPTRPVRVPTAKAIVRRRAGRAGRAGWALPGEVPRYIENGRAACRGRGEGARVSGTVDRIETEEGD